MEEETKYNFLKKIGLTESEIKVYLALLKLGTSSKGNLIKESKTAPSKIYEITDKLIDKGLCSSIIRNGIKYFMAASPIRIKDYLHKKQEEILKEEKELNKIIPELKLYYNKPQESTRVEVFLGWKGMETVYVSLLETAKKGQEVFIMGAGSGIGNEKLELFYTKYGRMALKKGLKIKVIFNENSKGYVKNIEKNIKKTYNKKFLFGYTPTEMLIFANITAIIIRKVEPIIILIKDKETANSFRKYFEELWKIAKR